MKLKKEIRIVSVTLLIFSCYIIGENKKLDFVEIKIKSWQLLFIVEGAAMSFGIVFVLAWEALYFV